MIFLRPFWVVVKFSDGAQSTALRGLGTTSLPYILSVVAALVVVSFFVGLMSLLNVVAIE